MHEYQKVEPGLKIEKWFETVELAPGIYNIIEKGLNLQDEVAENCYLKGFCVDFTEYGNAFACIDEDSTVMIVPNYDYQNLNNYYELLDKTVGLVDKLDMCGVSWIHISRDYMEIRSSLQRYHQYSNADFERYTQSFISGLSPSSLLVFNQAYKDTMSWS